MAHASCCRPRSGAPQGAARSAPPLRPPLPLRAAGAGAPAGLRVSARAAAPGGGRRAAHALERPRFELPSLRLPSLQLPGAGGGAAGYRVPRGQYRALGRSDVLVSPMGVGTWAWGNKLLWQYDESQVGAHDHKALRGGCSSAARHTHLHPSTLRGGCAWLRP